MSRIHETVLEKTDLGNDANDNRTNPAYLEGIHVGDALSNPTKTLADLAPLDIARMLSTAPKPREFLFHDKDGEGLLVKGTGSGVAGSGGSSKSTVALGFSYALAIRGVWLEQYQANRPMKVYFLTAEESEDEIHHRLASLHQSYCRIHSITNSKATEIEQLLITNLKVFSLLGAKVELTIANGRGGFEPGKAASDTVALVNNDAGEEDSMVIFDPLRKLTAGNEDGAALTAVINTCDWIRDKTLGTCTTMILQHTSQAAQQSSDDTQSAFRGATDLVDGLRWTMVIQKLLARDAKKLGIPARDRSKYRRYSFPKSNYSSERYDMYLKYSDGTYRPVVLKPAAEQSIEEKKEGALPVLCKVIATLEELDEPVSLKSILTHCKAKPQGDEIGSIIPVGKNQESLRILLLNTKQASLISSYQTVFPGNKREGEAWKLTDKGRIFLEAEA